MRIAAHLISPNMIKISFEGSVYSKTVVLFKSFCAKHTYSIPGHFCTHSCTDLASRAFIKSNLNRRDRNLVFIFCYRFNAVYGTKGYTDLAPGAIVFINNSNELGAVGLFPCVVWKFRDPFKMVVFYWHVLLKNKSGNLSNYVLKQGMKFTLKCIFL